MRLPMLALLAVLALAAATPARAAERVAFQVNATIPTAHLETVGFIPVKAFGDSRNNKVRAGGRSYIGPWANYVISRRSTSEALKFMLRSSKGRYGEVDDLHYADRELTAREKRSFKVLADLMREADVLVVAKGHPACNGLTREQARRIARGDVTRWSQVLGALPEGQPDQIALRYLQRSKDLHAEVRFGVTRYPSGARGDLNGGLVQAGKGDRAVAGVTSWSDVRRGWQQRICAVPLDGVAPSDATVMDRSYPEAFRITLVALKKRQWSPLARELRMRYVKTMTSAKVKQQLRDRGMLVAGDPVAAAPTPGSSTQPAPTPAPTATPAPTPDALAPTTDYQGRPITATRDDASAPSALIFLQLQRSYDGGSYIRWTFDDAGVLRRMSYDGPSQTCTQFDGTWSIFGAWRYGEFGGGLVPRVQMTEETARNVYVHLPNETPATAYIGGEAYARQRDQPKSCS